MREIREELGVQIAVGARVPGEWCLHDDLVLHLYAATLVEGEPTALDHHDALRWVPPEDFYSVDWLPSYREAVRALAGDASSSAVAKGHRADYLDRRRRLRGRRDLPRRVTR